MFSVTGPLMPKCVHRSEPVSRVATVSSIHNVKFDGCATPLKVPWIGRRRSPAAAARAPVSSARSCVRAGAPSRSLRRRFRSSASDCPPVASTTRRASMSPRVVGDPESARHPRSMSRTRVPAVSVAPARWLSSRSALRTSRARWLSGNSLPSASSCSPTPMFAEERDGVVNRQRAKDAANDRAPAAPEVGVGDDGIGDVAPRAAADEDLGAGPLRAVEQDDGAAGVQAPREDRGGQAGGAGADDGDVARTGGRGSA